MKRALVIAATGGFLKGFLTSDMLLLQEMGYEVHCAANGKSVSTFVPEEYFADLGVTFHQIDFSSTSPLSRQTWTARKQYKKLLKEYGFDAIHVHTPIPGAIVRLCSKRARRRGCKIVYTTHGLAFPKGCSKKAKLIYGTIEKLCAKHCDAIITINREDFEQVKKMKCKKVYYINGVGVNTERFALSDFDRSAYRREIGVADDEVMVLSVGELSPRKNHKVILRALSKLKDKKYVYVICGKAMTGHGTYDALAALSEELGVRTLFLGFRRDIPAITNCADIAALPSTREGLGFAGVEALTCGVPVVGTNVQGIRDYVINGETGFTYSAHDVDGFAEGIAKLSDPALRQSMQEACRAKAKEFDISVSRAQMKAIYKEFFS